MLLLIFEREETDWRSSDGEKVKGSKGEGLGSPAMGKKLPTNFFSNPDHSMSSKGPY
jgi:hypothetical protein